MADLEDLVPIVPGQDHATTIANRRRELDKQIADGRNLGARPNRPHSHHARKKWLENLKKERWGLG